MEHWKGKCETTPPINSTTKIQNRNAPVRRPPSETASKPDQTSHRPLSTEQLLTPTQHHRRPILRVWTRRREREALLATMQKVRRTKEGVEEEGGGKEHENGEPSRRSKTSKEHTGSDGQSPGFGSVLSVKRLDFKHFTVLKRLTNPVIAQYCTIYIVDRPAQSHFLSNPTGPGFGRTLAIGDQSGSISNQTRFEQS